VGKNGGKIRLIRIGERGRGNKRRIRRKRRGKYREGRQEEREIRRRMGRKVK
jgi:hypothetical protein